MIPIGRKVFLLLAIPFLFVIPNQASAEQNLPAGTLKSAELKKLLFAKTVEVEFNKSEFGLRYFNPYGGLRQVRNDRLQKGKWKVKNDRLCIKLGQPSWDCRILVREKDQYQQYIVKQNGKHKRELSYNAIHAGRQLTQLGRSPILPSDTLTKKQLIELFSDKTVKSVTANKGRVSMSYYGPSGTLEQTRNGIKRTGKWRANNKDRICLQMNNLKEKCRIVVKQGLEYKKYIVRKNGQHQHSVTYRDFSVGNRL